MIVIGRAEDGLQRLKSDTFLAITLHARQSCLYCEGSLGGTPLAACI